MKAGPHDSHWRGICPVLVTPFLESGEIDLDGLVRQVHFCTEVGAHGLVYPGVVSEFFALTEAERRESVAAVIEAAAGRVPVIVGVSAPTTTVAADLSEHARDAGADGLMAMLPYVEHFFPPDGTFVTHHFATIARAGNLPIVLQNARMGHRVDFQSLAALIESVPEVRYVKQETSPATHELSAAITAVGDSVHGVFGGLGGIYLLNELDRGACGSMPAPPFVDVMVRAWNRYQTGDRNGARELVVPLGALFSVELLYNVSVIKEVLRRRGVIKDSRCRVPAPVLDRTDQRELDELLAIAEVGPWSPTDSSVSSSIAPPALSLDESPSPSITDAVRRRAAHTANPSGARGLRWMDEC